MKKAILLALIISLTVSPALCGNILIPGYDTIRFKAGEIVQDVLFRNPEENNCRFKMSIYLSDGTEIWTADDYLNPGEAFVRIDLELKLERGTYRNALMKYECFSLDGLFKMNGAEIRVTIEAE